MKSHKFLTEDVQQLYPREVSAKFNNPQVTSDLNDVLGWFPGSTVTFSIDYNVSTAKFATQAKEMFSTFDKFPEDAERVKEIRKLIVQGKQQHPIFVDSSNNFILEGRHRITAFYELNLPTVTRVWVHEKKQVKEIAHADVLGDLSMPDDSIISNSTIVGRVDSKDVYLYKQNDSAAYFFYDQKIQAIVLLADGNKIKALKNFVKQPGYITALIGFIVHEMHTKLVISNDEPLTSQGYRWLRLLLLRNGKGFTITDQNGKFPNMQTLEKEWNQCINSDCIGDTSIYISESAKTVNTLRIARSALLATTMWIGDTRLT